jgi:Na+/proline symporter/nitrogen-specific signal transduction histidine kinase
VLSPALVLGLSLAYLGLLFAVAAWGDRRAAAGRSVAANAWVYALSIAVYCTAWTYFGSVGRAAASGVWFLPVYLGPTLAMVLAWTVLRKMIRIARRQRITSIADFIASRYGKSPLLAGLVTVITVVGIVPYIALQLKAIATGYALLTAPVGGTPAPAPADFWHDGTFYAALLLAGFTMMFGTRHLDSTERHEGLVTAIAFESVVKLLAFLAVGAFVTWGLFGGVADLFARVAEQPALRSLLTLGQGASAGFAYEQWFALTMLSALSVIFLPRQFQVIVVENVDERHLKRAAWVFPAYLLLINLFVLPIAFGGLLLAGSGANADAFVISLPLQHGAEWLALAVFIGGLSAATGMIIVEAIAVSTMVCNELVMPLLLRVGRLHLRTRGDLTGLLLTVRRAAIVALLLLGYAYYHVAGEAYALVSIGLISFAAVAQFAPAALGGMYWKGGTRAGAVTGLVAGATLWAYTLLLPSIAKSGWMPAAFLEHGPFGLALLRPESLFGLSGLDGLTHALFWSLLANVAAYVGVSLWRPPSAAEASQAALFVDVGDAAAHGGPAFWRGRAKVADLRALLARFLGPERAARLLAEHARRSGTAEAPTPGDGREAALRDGREAALRADAQLVQFVETQLAGAVGSASARVLVASVVQEEALALQDVLQILEEASQLRAYSRALEAQRAELQRATAELRAANERLEGLDRLKDDFMSSVTHELRTPLTSIRALAELMADDPQMAAAQRAQFLGIVVAETERLSRLVNQVLDLAKIESGHAPWRDEDVDLCALARQAAQAMAQPLREQGTALTLALPQAVPPLRADADRLMQVLLNLLGNAAKFVPRTGGHIVLRLQADAQGATVQVHDNGPGVAPEQRALIFERFQQGGDRAQRPPGTGLGLTISRQIVEHFGGRIAVVAAAPDAPARPGMPGLAPDAGQGACFEFWLPWRLEAHDGLRHRVQDPATTGPTETPHGDQDPHRRR